MKEKKIKTKDVSCLNIVFASTKTGLWSCSKIAIFFLKVPFVSFDCLATIVRPKRIKQFSILCH